jgi:hypothetical protein
LIHNLYQPFRTFLWWQIIFNQRLIWRLFRCFARSMRTCQGASEQDSLRASSTRSCSTGALFVEEHGSGRLPGGDCHAEGWYFELRGWFWNL